MSSRRVALGWALGAGRLPLLAWSAEGLRFEWEDVLGETGKGRGELREPVDVALIPGGEVAVLDAERGAVVVFAESGAWRRTLGGGAVASPDLGLSDPAALTADEGGRLWVADRGNHRLVVLDPGGARLRVVGGLGALAGRFRSPSDLAIDSGGRVCVADTGNERLQILEADGSFVVAWDGRARVRRGRVEKPVTVAWSEYGRGGLWFANKDSARLEKLDPLGEWEETLDLARLVAGPVRIERLEIEPAFHRMFVADSIGKRVLVVSRRGSLLAEIRNDDRGSMEPRGLAVNRILDVFVADADGGRIPWFRKKAG